MRDLLLILHIVAGFTALISGLIPMLSKKGGPLHNRGGRIYFIAMTLVFFTAVPLSILKSNFFLFSVGILSYYAAFTGFRLPKRKDLGFYTIDKAAAIVTLITSLGMIAYAVNALISGDSGIGIVLGVFGIICFFMSFADTALLVGWRSRPENKHHWLFSHIGRMGGSYIAAFTAFTVTNLEFIPSMIGWLGPTVIGTAFISAATRKYRKKFAGSPKKVNLS